MRKTLLFSNVSINDMYLIERLKHGFREQVYVIVAPSFDRRIEDYKYSMHEPDCVLKIPSEIIENHDKYIDWLLQVCIQFKVDLLYSFDRTGKTQKIFNELNYGFYRNGTIAATCDLDTVNNKLANNRKIKSTDKAVVSAYYGKNGLIVISTSNGLNISHSRLVYSMIEEIFNLYDIKIPVKFNIRYKYDKELNDVYSASIDKVSFVIDDDEIIDLELSFSLTELFIADYLSINLSHKLYTYKLFCNNNSKILQPFEKVSIY